MKILKGIPVSPGVAIARVFVIDDLRGYRVPRRSVRPEAVDAEIDRLEQALRVAIEELQAIHAEAVGEMGEDAARIFLFHIGALSDKRLTDPIRDMVRAESVSAEHAASLVFGGWAERFSRGDPNDPASSKSTDMHDLAIRVIGHLMGERRGMLSHLEGATVIAASELTPSQTAGFDREKVVGMVTDLGGPTSHTAIVARALGLPAVVGCQNMTDSAVDANMVIVDGDRGTVILDPDEDTIREFERRQEAAVNYRLSLAELADLPAITTDGVEIELLGNIEFPEETQAVLELGGVGVGLYRTEFLYLTRERQPTEEEHFEAYKRCIELLDGRPLTVRTVDLGADKYTQAQSLSPERNPFLGLRSIRYCLQNLGMFRSQLRAILRASALGPMKVMFPLITSIHEYHAARSIMRDAMEDLQEMGEPFDRKIEMGIMVETPSSAIMADQFAREVDFFSIGTNDLVQYTLAVDRTNEQVANLYQPAHPAVLKLIRDVARAARRREIPVSCCGEAASDLTFAPLLLGLGVRTLSATASGIPGLKKLIRSISISQCERLVKKTISFESEVEAAAFARDRVRKLVPEAFGGGPSEG